VDPSSILIIGANGQVGKALQLNYPSAHAVDFNKLDITNSSQLANFNWQNIKVVINAAAYTNVDAAETSDGRKAAWQINSLAVANLVRICNQHDITLIHISSDYVFDGNKNPHLEDESFSPLGVYGQSKAAGDIAASLANKYFVIRTSWVIGDGKNFVRTMLSLAQKGISPAVVNDQIGRLTFASELVRAIDYLLTKKVSYGVYNVSNAGQPASWADIARSIFKVSGHNDLIVKDISTKEYLASKPNSAPRPLNSTLNLDKLIATGFVSKTWQADLKNYLFLDSDNT